MVSTEDLAAAAAAAAVSHPCSSSSTHRGSLKLGLLGEGSSRCNIRRVICVLVSNIQVVILSISSPQRQS